MRSVSIVPCVLILVVGLSASGGAQDNEYYEDGGESSAGCGYMDDCGGGHVVPPIGNGKKFAHTGCKICVDRETGATLPDGDCHPTCEEGLLGFRAPYAAARLAAIRGDVSALLRIGSTAGGFVVYNRERRSVQILSCTGESVVVNVPLANEYHRRIASRLPNPASSVTRLALRVERAKAAKVAAIELLTHFSVSSAVPAGITPVAAPGSEGFAWLGGLD